MNRGALACIAAIVLGGSAVAAPGAAIVGGTPSSEPAVVALVRGDDLVCSGTVIAEHAVLTAAHCVTGDELPEVIVAGVRRTPIAKRVSPFFDEVTLASDIAVLVFDPPLEVAPLALATISAYRAGDSVDIIGFGRQSPDDATPFAQRRGTAIIDVIERDVLRSSGPQRTCEGDSGGPALFGGTIVGVTSSGDANCAELSRHTRISDVYAIITDAVRRTGKKQAFTGDRCFYPANCASGDCLPALDEPRRSFCTPSCDEGCPTYMACIDDLCRWNAPSPGAEGTFCDVADDCVDNVCLRSGDLYMGTCTRRCFSDLPGFECPSGTACLPAREGGEACFAPVPDDGCRIAREPALFAALFGLAMLIPRRRRRR